MFCTLGRKEYVSLKNPLTDFVNLTLKIVDVLMQADAEHVLDVGEVHLGEDTSSDSLGFVGERPARHAGNSVEKIVRLPQAEPD